MIYLSKAYTYFIVFGEEFSPSELTNQINIKPTDFGIKGEKRKSGAALKESFWKYQLNKTDVLEGIDESLLSLIEVFNDKVNLLKDFMLKNGLKSKCFIVIESQNEESNGVTLTPDFIDFLHKLNTSVEIDIYPQS
jgi:hypothetical protein